MKGLIWATTFAAVLGMLVDDIFLRLKLAEVERQMDRATVLVARTQATNETLFTTLGTCRETVSYVSEQSRSSTETRLAPEMEVLRRRASRYYTALHKAKGAVPQFIGPVSIPP